MVAKFVDKNEIIRQYGSFAGIKLMKERALKEFGGEQTRGNRVDINSRAPESANEILLSRTVRTHEEKLMWMEDLTS